MKEKHANKNVMKSYLNTIFVLCFILLFFTFYFKKKKQEKLFIIIHMWYENIMLDLWMIRVMMDPVSAVSEV